MFPRRDANFSTTYAVTRTFFVIGSVGYQEFDDGDADNEVDDPTWRVAARWQPSSRTEVEVGYGQRDDEQSFDGDLRYNISPRTRLTASYGEVLRTSAHTDPYWEGDFGNVLAGADLDGDGYSDLLVGDPDADAVHVYAGSASGIATTASVTLSGERSGIRFSQGALAGPGDIDQDGDDEVLIGSPSGDYAQAVAGGPVLSLLSGTGGERLAESDPQDYGAAVDGAGDVNGDGCPDVVVGGRLGPAYVHLAEVDADGDGAPGCGVEPTDCDDTDPAVHPDATELPGDGIDSDCDGLEDCLEDADGDGHHAGELTPSDDLDCDDEGEATDEDPGGDCDDDDPAVHPGAEDRPGDGVDSDCDGAEDCLEDADGDGYHADEIIPSDDLDCDDEGEATDEDPGGDCDDDDPGVHPGADELAGDGMDGDCDGEEDCLEDADDDGYPSDGIVPSDDLDCDDEGESPPGPPADCDDLDAAAYPGAEEPEGSTVDLNCDGLTAEPTAPGGRFIGRSCSSLGGGAGAASLPALLALLALLVRRREGHGDEGGAR